MISTLPYSQNYSDTQTGGEPLRASIKRVTTSEVIILRMHVCLEILSLCFPVITGGARLQTSALTSILPGEAKEPFRGDPGKLIAGCPPFESSSEGAPEQLKLLQPELELGLCLNRHFNWMVPRRLYFLSSLCLHYGIRVAKMLTETSSVDQNIT